MRLRNRHLPVAAAAILIVGLAAALPASAQGKDELWEISSRMEMQGMPMAMPGKRVGDCTAPTK